MTSEEESVGQASNARRERLKALRAAKEYASIPDEDQANNDIVLEGPLPENRDKVNMAVEQAAAEEDTAENEDSEQNVSKEEESEKAEEDLGLKFRNYIPRDERLQKGMQKPVELPKFEDPVAAVPQPAAEDPFVNIAPKKPSWDLRRDVQKRLEKLERRTQKAIYQIMQEQQKLEEDAMMSD